MRNVTTGKRDEHIEVTLYQMLSLLNRETRRGVDEEKKNKTRGTGLSDDEHKQIFWMRSQLTKNLRFPEIKS